LPVDRQSVASSSFQKQFFRSITEDLVIDRRSKTRHGRTKAGREPVDADASSS